MNKVLKCVSRRLLPVVSTILFLSLVSSSCRNKSASGQVGQHDQPKADTAKAAPSYKPVYNLYIETSGSMAGYISRPSQFKNTVSGLITDVKTKDLADAININFIAARVCEVRPNASSNDIDYFIKNLNPATVSSLNCGSGSSDLPQIFKQVIRNTDSAVNIIVSDCIFSLNGQDAAQYLEQYKNSIKLFFSDSLKKDSFSTLILKYSSEFNGVYYNESGRKANPDLTGKGIKRPYYIILVGKSEFVNQFAESIKYKGYEGYAYSYLMQPPSTQPVSAKLLRFPKKGDYAIKMPASNLQIENAQTGGRTGKSEAFQFSFAANLAAYSFDQEYLRNPANYNVPENYKIDAISEVDSTRSAELKGYTHLFTLSTTELRQSQEVSITLKNHVPQWVSKSSTTDDANIFDREQQDRTFGLEYLVRGIAGAYDNRFDTEKQFAVAVKVSKGEVGGGSRSGFNWWIAVVAFAVLGIIIWLKNKK